MRKVDIITMGCSKNLVDSEQLMGQFQQQGYQVFHNPQEPHGDIAVVNTCGFIGDAKEESINMILELCELKDRGELRQVYVMGCLSERYLQELKAEIGPLDEFYVKFDWPQLLADLGHAAPAADSLPQRTLTTPSHYAYLKISEGCNRHCAYCAIPIITGAHESRPMEEILDEVRRLVSRGVKEFQVIAQELTYYGLDLYGEQRLPQLIEQMAQIPGVEWIRLHYAYPTDFPLDLLRVMRTYDNVCNYLDIALQHISDRMLQRMHRHITKQQTLELIDTLRREVPDITLRTTLMVGFPGETEEDFEELLRFVREVRFERLGAFAYSEEEGTYAARHYTDDVPPEVKEARLDRLMQLQETIAADVAENLEGQTLRTVIDRTEGDYYVGRTEMDSPEVDCEVLIRRDEAHPLQIGAFYDVRIDHAETFDLYGSVL